MSSWSSAHSGSACSTSRIRAARTTDLPGFANILSCSRGNTCMKSKRTSDSRKLDRATLQAMRQQAMISAVSARGELRVMVHDDAVTAAVFREFLGRLMLGARQPVVLVLDGHPIHKARLVREFVAAPKGHLKLFCLPPYSPHLNPDEQVWAHVKHIFSKRLVQSEDEMQWPAIASLDRIQKLPALAKPFFRQPECQYATM
ncbi:transposase [Burkholderia ubonensis]|uniref:transposase n=1 Tax=Burkholderia ubonensis TaxID=101571 RepID=UPI0009B56516